MDLKTKWGVGAAQFGVIRNEDGSTESSTPTKADVDDAHDLNHDIDEAVLDETSANWQAKEPRWVPDPESRNVKGRTIVLCFDGTGEHFHETVCLFSCAFYIWYVSLKAALAELKRYQACRASEEGRHNQADGLLSNGDRHYNQLQP